MSNASSIRCLITAGPTREFLDPVRFLSNPSTGKMGYALAEAALRLGWNVDLVAGPVNLPEPEGTIFYPVVSAEEMYHQVDALFDACDLFIMAAAVSDFRPSQYLPQKEKKSVASLRLELEPTRDILATLAERKLNQTVVGFAAETENLEPNARAKLVAKNCDFIVANDLSQPGAGFAADTNTVIFLAANGSNETLGPALKTDLATQIIDRLAARHH
ncbi:MAG: Coenzyme A biosynthesis bifunctional protein CoaBC [Opitutia bacterium UBA7350]|nr:MAG: Coenzyme A biosynthesis bifunctional protein CoaBC [Opitutae bacterium UBA7350]